MHRRLILIVAIACAILGLAACSDDKKSDTPAATGGTITISGFKFSAVSVKPGATVTVENKDTTTHTVTADTSGQFDTGNIDGAETATFTAPSAPGSYPYHCGIHQTTMKGTLTVTS
jgi:plastocyanin